MKPAKVTLEDRIQALAAADHNFRKENGSQFTKESWHWKFRCGNKYYGIPAELVLYQDVAFITTLSEDSLELFGNQVPASAVLNAFHQKVVQDLDYLRKLPVYVKTK